MFKNFFINMIEKRAQKFIIGAVGGFVTWVSANGYLPLDQFISDAQVSGIAATTTAILVYAVRNN